MEVEGISIIQALHIFKNINITSFHQLWIYFASDNRPSDLYISWYFLQSFFLFAKLLYKSKRTSETSWSQFQYNIVGWFYNNAPITICELTAYDILSPLVCRSCYKNYKCIYIYIIPFFLFLFFLPYFDTTELNNCALQFTLQICALMFFYALLFMDLI